MIFLYVTLIVLVFALVFFNAYRVLFLNKPRPVASFQKPKITMFDVRHLLMAGKKELAIATYMDIFKVSIDKAKKDVEDLERNLKV